MISLMVMQQPLIVRADTTEDLLNVYGMTLGGPVRSDVEQEIEAAENDLGNALFLQHEMESYNKVIEKYVQERARQQAEVTSSAISYLNQMEKYSQKIEYGILSSDIGDLLTYDSNYKTSNKYAQTLIESLDYYQSYYSYKETDFDISGIVDRVYTARQLYSESIDAASIGDVKNIRFIMPIDRKVNSSYGMRIDPIHRTEIRFHAGTDYYAPEGTEIYSLFSGEVISSGWSSSIGYFVTIQSSENIKFMVCHCSELFVTEGDYVSQYDLIALSGSTGSRCDGPHLHMALYINGVSYDVDKLFTQDLK